VNPKLNFHVLIHKVDGDNYLSDDHKNECQREIKKSITDELAESQIKPRYHMTSIYDHTIFAAMSQIVQGLSPQLPHLEKLLNQLIASCSIEKAFLFDVISKIYVATDSSPADIQTYELCSDMIDVVLDVSNIYGLKGGKEDPWAFDADSASIIKLSNNYVLTLPEVHKFLALVCLMRAQSYSKTGLVEYNFSQVKSTLNALLDQSSSAFASPSSGSPQSKDKEKTPSKLGIKEGLAKEKEKEKEKIQQTKQNKEKSSIT